MEKEKLNPMQMVAREISPHIGLLDELEIRTRIMGLFEHLYERAAVFHPEDDSPEALRASQEYLVAVEIVNYFGTQLIAFEDIELADGGITN